MVPLADMFPPLHVSVNRGVCDQPCFLSFFKKPFPVVYVFWLPRVFAAMWVFSSCGEQGLLFVVVCGLLLWSTGSGVQTSTVVASGLQSTRSGAVGQGLSCSMVARGIFPDQRKHLGPQHWQADFQPGKSLCFLFNSSKLTFFFSPGTSPYLSL